MKILQKKKKKKEEKKRKYAIGCKSKQYQILVESTGVSTFFHQRDKGLFGTPSNLFTFEKRFQYECYYILHHQNYFKRQFCLDALYSEMILSISYHIF